MEDDPSLQCEVVTYHSKNSKPEECWTAYCVLPTGEQWLVRFAGTDELTVINKAKVFWAKERARWIKLDTTTGTITPVRARITRHGEHVIGKVWLVNHELKERVRVTAEEVDGYLARGFVRGFMSGYVKGQ
jgi:hypothetical protein